MKRVFFALLTAAFAVTLAQSVSAQVGCKKWLGREGEFVCEQKTGYDDCVAKLRKGEIDYCVLSGQSETAIRRISTAEAVNDLNKLGCERDGLSGNFACSTAEALNTCVSYKNYGAVSGCKKILPKAVKGSLYVYAVGTDKALWTVKNTNGKWGDWQRIGGEKQGGELNDGIDACSPNPGVVLALFGKSLNFLYQATFDYGKSQMPSVVSLKSQAGSIPTIACSPGDNAWMFVRGVNNTSLYGTRAENAIWKRAYDGEWAITEIENGTSHPPNPTTRTWYQGYFDGFSFKNTALNLRADDLGGNIKGSPDAVMVDGNPMVFVRGRDDTVWLRYRTPSVWKSFQPVSATKITSDPTAVYLAKRKAIWLFARGSDNRLWATQITNFDTMKSSVWLPWSDVSLAGNPDATSWDGNRVDVVARAADGSVLHFWRDDSEGLVKKPQVETVPNGKVVGDMSIVGVQW